MLSNTAVPYYYGQFRDAVIRGEIPVCEKVSMQMNLIDDLIRNPNYYYDDHAIDAFVSYCENELTLVDGSDLKLMDSFKLWAEDLLSWFYFIDISVYNPKTRRYEKYRKKKRLRSKQYLIVGRGAAKTMYDACVQSYGLNCDKSTTHQITTAPTMKQAEEVMSPIRTSITRARGPLFKFLTEGSLTKNFLNGSFLEVRPMTVDKLQGLRCKYATIDEWLSCDIKEDVVGCVEQGASKIDNYIIIASSSEGTVRNSVGDTVKMELDAILKGDYFNPYTSIWWYKLDDIKEIGHPELWLKANPNIGISVSYEAYQRDVERAEKVPSTRNDILAKRFGIPTEGYTYFFTYEETIKHKKREYWQMPCALGADLSQGDDFCAFTFIFPNGRGGFGVKVRSYITSRTLDNLPSATYMKYQEFMREGSLIVMEGSVLNMMDVYDDLDAHIEKMEYDIYAFGYDPYNAKEFIERWVKEHGPNGIVKVIQGAKTESVPLGEIKILSEDGLLLFDEELMSFAMGNCIVLEDTNGNRKLLKKRREDKIDNVAAMLDAYVAYKLNIEEFE